MTTKVMEFLKIYKGESLKLLTFFSVGILLQAGIAIGISSSDALFLCNVGADKLPLLFILMPIVMILFTPFYSFFIEKYKIDRIFILTLLTLFFGGIIIFFALSYYSDQAILSSSVYYAIKIYTYVWMLTIYTLFWNFVDEYFDILDAKRLYPILNGGIAVGAIVGGGIVTLFISKIGIEKLFIIWSALSVIAIPIVLIIIRKWKKITKIDEEIEQTFIKQTSEVFSMIKRSRFITLINIVFFITLFITTICEYQYLDIFSRNNNEHELAILFGKLFLFVNIFNVVVNFFIFNKLVSYIGVRNTTLIQPLTYLIAFAYLLLDYNYNAALFGFFAYQGIMISVDFNNWNFLFNAVESRFKKQIRAFVEELMDPAATSLAGVALFFLAPVITPGGISAIAFAGALLFLIMIFFLRNNYRESMISNLKKGWLDFSKTSYDLLIGIDENEIDLLLKNINEIDEINEKNRSVIYFSFYTLCFSNVNKALESLFVLLKKIPIEKQHTLRPFLTLVFNKGDHETDRRLLQYIEKEDIPLEHGLIAELVSHNLVQVKNLSIGESSSVEEIVAVGISLWNSSNPQDGQKVMQMINEMLRGGEDEIVTAIHILGRIKQSKYVHFLVPFLESPETKIRNEALKALSMIVDKDSSRILPEIYKNIQNGTYDERILALKIINKINDSNSIIPVLSMSGVFTPFEKRRVEDLLISIGLKSVPTIIAILSDSHNSYESRLISARALGKLSFPQFEELHNNIIEEEIIKAYKFLYYFKILLENDTQSPAINILSKFYNDVYSVIIEFILEMLTIGGRLPDYELIISSIRSKNQKVMGNAIETLEQGVRRDIWKILLPLVDSRNINEKINFYHSVFSEEDISINEIVEHSLESPFPLERSIGAQALWELDNEKSINRLRGLIETGSNKLFKDTIMSLFQKHDGQMKLNTIDKLYYLSCSPFFSTVRMNCLETIVGSSQEAYFDNEFIFKKDDPGDYLYLIIEGKVIFSNDDVICDPGYVFGDDELFMSDVHKQDARGENLKVLMIPGQDLINHIKALPKLGIALLEKMVISE